MTKDPTDHDELKRLSAVERTRLFGTPAEERFDRITRLACRLFDVPVAIIDIVASEAVWLKSAQGLDGSEFPRESSYCRHTVLQDDVCMIRDALTDPRVSESASAATYRFYAGVPLKFEGRNVGAFCIADVTPRTLTEEDTRALRDFAALAERELQVAALSEAQLQLAASHRELETKAYVDALTRLWNRGAIQEIGTRELDGGSPDTHTGFALLDIDHFKKINDTFGHAAGDEVLRVISARVRAAIRPTDAVGRYGGEEFLIVLPGLGASSMVDVCERIRRAVSVAPVVVDGTPIHVTCSIGCTIAQDRSFDSVVRQADASLYRAKRSGRDRVEVACEMRAAA